jgi:DNA ligase (NAD+)
MTDTILDLDTPIDALSQDDAAALLRALAAEVARHDELYHGRDAPEISDAEYDRLFRRLRALEDAFPDLVEDASPTATVGAAPRGDLPTVAHEAPMLSLDSTNDPGDVGRFDERMRKAMDADAEYLLQPKLDGVSMELVYESGTLVRAVTRGDGRSGEAVTQNVLTIPSVPRGLATGSRAAPDRMAVRGEVLMRLRDFEALNEQLVASGSEAYVNPRNATSGAVRQLDPEVTASRPLTFVAYDILHIEGTAFRTDRDSVDALADWGFALPERIALARSVDEILDYHAAFAADRDDLDYEIDGVVIKVNDLDERVDLGSTSHHPRWALAFKFEPRKEITRIERIAVQVGRTGVLTPVALLLPVDVGGVTVSRATLHNREELERKDIREGDLVRVQRAGDVIPQVVEVIEEPGRERAGPFQMPERCPDCDTPVMDEGPFTRCPNRFGCSAQLKARIVHFGSRHGLDIEGLGAETAAMLVERGLVEDLADLFALDEVELRSLPGFAELKAANLVSAIAARRSTELSRFLFALGIPEVGVTVARDLAREFRSFDALRSATRETLEGVAGVGPKMADQIASFFEEPRTRASIDRLHLVIDELRVPASTADGGPLDGTRFVFTGGLDALSRSHAKRIVEAAGGRVSSSVSGETDYLVAGEGGGAKRDKAADLGVPVLTEQEFLEMLDRLGVEVS